MKNNEKLTKGLIIRMILIIILVILMILSIFYKMFLPIADLVTGFIFGLMAYDRRENKTLLIIFILFGLSFVFMGGYSLLNGG